MFNNDVHRPNVHYYFRIHMYQDATDWMHAVLQEPICKISGSCYDDGEEKPGQTCLRCRVDTSDTEWTLEVMSILAHVFLWVFLILTHFLYNATALLCALSLFFKALSQLAHDHFKTLCDPAFWQSHDGSPTLHELSLPLHGIFRSPAGASDF